MPENENTDSVISNLGTAGKFQILDSETNEVLMNNDDIKAAKVMYGSDPSGATSGTVVYLDIEFDKEGTNKIKRN